MAIYQKMGGAGNTVLLGLYTIHKKVYYLKVDCYSFKICIIE